MDTDKLIYDMNVHVIVYIYSHTIYEDNASLLVTCVFLCVDIHESSLIVHNIFIYVPLF